MVLDILSSRYVLGIAAFALFALPIINKTGELLTSLAATMASLPGAS